MKIFVFGFYSFSIFWNLIQNLRSFHAINHCSSFDQYLALRRKPDVMLGLELLSSLYIIAFLCFTPIFHLPVNSFSKLLFLIYGLYLTYRFCTAFLKFSSRRFRRLDEETASSLKDELSIMDEILDVRSFLMLGPIIFVVLETTFFALTTILIFQEQIL
jgi:hypothetical protein